MKVLTSGRRGVRIEFMKAFRGGRGLHMDSRIYGMLSYIEICSEFGYYDVTTSCLSDNSHP